MRSNFDTPMKVTGGVVEACGELDWDGETGVSVMVTLVQRTQHAVGTASSQSTFEPPADEWMVDVEAAGANQFTDGPAHAIGLLSAVEGHGVSVFHWSQDVQLGQT
jgi:hypothetical protein